MVCVCGACCLLTAQRTYYNQLPVQLFSIKRVAYSVCFDQYANEECQWKIKFRWYVHETAFEFNISCCFCVSIWPVICYHYGVNKDRRAHFVHTHTLVNIITHKGVSGIWFCILNTDFVSVLRFVCVSLDIGGSSHLIFD